MRKKQPRVSDKSWADAIQAVREREERERKTRVVEERAKPALAQRDEALLKQCERRLLKTSKRRCLDLMRTCLDFRLSTGLVGWR